MTQFSHIFILNSWYRTGPDGDDSDADYTYVVVTGEDIQEFPANNQNDEDAVKKAFPSSVMHKEVSLHMSRGKVDMNDTIVDLKCAYPDVFYALSKKFTFEWKQRPSTFARQTAQTLSKSAIRQIVEYLDSSARYADCAQESRHMRKASEYLKIVKGWDDD